MEATVARPPESAYAREGTAAHALGELKARQSLLAGKADPRPEWRQEFSISPAVEEEMDAHTDAYVELLRERMARVPNSTLLLEQRVYTGIPSCWGTSDAIIVSPEHVEIIDLKYGQGVRVEADHNSQLMLYGVGALETFGYILGEPREVYMTVFQPRLRHTDTYEMSAEELRAWRDSLRPIAEAALGDDAPFGPSEEACRWCPLSGQCRAQRDFVLAADFGSEPDLLSPEEVGEALKQLPLMKSWMAALEQHALDAIYSQGQDIPGYKVVMSGGRRVVSDATGALEALSAMGYELDTVAPRTLKGIGVLEKLLGSDFDIVLGNSIIKTEGKPSLAPESDRRPSVDPNTEAKKEFQS